MIKILFFCNALFKLSCATLFSILLCTNTFYSNDFVDFLYNKNNQKYDTGYFYDINSKLYTQISPECLDEKSIDINSIDKQYYSQPVDPFSGDFFVANKNFLTTYFSHLNSNMPMNILGICGYTAISNFLSFYDSYWNDNFIPDQYDSEPSKILSSILFDSETSRYESPGVWNNITYESPSMETLINEIFLSGITDVNCSAFKESLDRKIMQQIYNQIDSGTFLGKLFQIAINNGSINPHFFEYEYHNNNNNYVDGVGVNNQIMNDVLRDYIADNQSLNGWISIVTSSIVENSFTERQRIRSEVVDIVKSGRPAIVGGNRYTYDSNGIIVGEAGHMVVAYDYDEESDILYGNMGWSAPDTSHCNLNEYFTVGLSDYWTISMSQAFSKFTSNNYIFVDKTAYYFPGTNQIYNLIKPSDFGFPNQYGGSTNSTNSQIVLQRTGEIIDCNRLRCGFINNESINLSTRRYEPGIAFLELNFDKCISFAKFNISWWSENEAISQANSSYKIEFLYNNEYFTAVDLWRDVFLSNDRNFPTPILVNFPNGVSTIRIYGEANNPIYSQNKGRLSIKDLYIQYSNI